MHGAHSCLSWSLLWVLKGSAFIHKAASVRSRVLRHQSLFQSEKAENYYWEVNSHEHLWLYLTLFKLTKSLLLLLRMRWLWNLLFVLWNLGLLQPPLMSVEDALLTWRKAGRNQWLECLPALVPSCLPSSFHPVVAFLSVSPGDAGR